MGKNKWKQKSLAMLLAFTMGLGGFAVNPQMSYAEVAVADTYLDKEIIKEQAEPSDITKDTDLEDKLEPDITTPAVIELEPLIALAVEQKSFASGKGIEGNPYKIANEADLRFLSEMVNKGEAGYTDKYYVLTDNINVESGLNWAPIGTQSSPFKGNFDGGGKAIRGLSIDATEYYNVGLFGYIQNGYVSNVEINSKITKIDKVNSNVGILAGVIKDSEIKSVTVKGSIIDYLVEDTTNIGGLVGMTDKSQIKASSSDVEIKLSIENDLSNIGGLVGFNNDKSMISENSYSEVVFEIIKNAISFKTNNIGGFVGKNEGSLEGCRSDVDGKSQSTGNLSGFVGSNEGYIANCISTGNLAEDSKASKQIRKSGNPQATIKAGAIAIQEGRVATNLLGFVSNNTEKGQIIGCSSAVNIQSSDVCGVSGFISRNYGFIRGCSSNGEFVAKAESQLAGFILSNHGEITNCSSGNILSGQDESQIAGFCIYNIKKIANCYSTSSERAYLDSKDKQLSDLNSSEDAYRFVLDNYGTIVNAYATGMIGQKLAFQAPGFEEDTKNIYASLASFKQITPVASVRLMTESEMMSSSGVENALVDILNNNLISEKKAGGENEQDDWNGWMVGSENNGFPVLTEYIPVTRIKLKETSVIAGTDLCLEGSVEPFHAKQKVISWSVVDKGNTGAYIESSNILRTKESGIIKIKATVENGSSEKLDYTKDFDINVIPEPILSGKVTMPWGAEFMVNNKATDKDPVSEHTTVIALNGEKWYVIGAKDTGLTLNEGAMTLFYENKNKISDFDKQNKKNIYETSNLKSNMEMAMMNSSEEEKNAIIKRDLLVEEYVVNKLCDGVSKTEVKDASLWPMSPDEAKKINIDLLSSNESTWLRSPGYKEGNSKKIGEFAAYVENNGAINVYGDTVISRKGFRPAFYLNLSSILLTSDASVSKPVVSDNLKLIGKSSNAVQKLTMYSNRLKLEEATTTSQLKPDSAIEVNYSADTIRKTLSAIVENSKGEVTYYGNLVESIPYKRGKVSLTLPTDFDSKTMKLKVFIEEVNGENKTNYASTPVEVIGTVAPDNKAPVMTAGKTERTSGGNATVKSNDKAQNIGKETIKEENGKKIIELSITPEFVIAHVSKDFKFGDDKNIVEIKVTDTDAEMARVVLTGNMVKKLEDNDAVLSIQKDNIKYNIPAKEMTVESVAKKLNVDSSKLKEMQIEIEISKISGELAQKYQEIAKVGNNEVIIPPVEFNIIGRVTGEDGSKQMVNINRFSSFVERTVELPQGNESKGAMTGIVFNSDGTYSPVPTKLVTENGRSYVKMNSLTNSTYSVIYNPITVDSVKLHWSESSVNDMASRLVLVDTKSFEPNKAISRAEFANYIVRALGLYQGDTKAGQSEFTDVKSDNPSLKGITIANQWGIIGGYPDGSFRPQNTITREEAMSMYSRAMDIAKLDKSDDSRILNYKDQAKVSSWAYKAVQKTLGSGVFNGRTAQNIEPKGTFTCSEAAVAIRNLLIKAELING